MDEKKVPYIAHEAMMARMERTIKRLWILALVLVVLLMGTNAAWIWYESQFEEMTVTQELQSDRNGNAIIYDGVHINGESETDGQN